MKQLEGQKAMFSSFIWWKEGVFSNFPFILFKFVAGFDKVKNHPSVRKLRFSTHVFHESHHVYITQPINGNFTSFGFDTFFPVLRSSGTWAHLALVCPAKKRFPFCPCNKSFIDQRCNTKYNRNQVVMRMKKLIQAFRVKRSRVKLSLSLYIFL